ncbi:GGDEF domain-containing protein [Granulicella sp. S190]|uniref:GGDEF domain-containing protein n=1 Tax=Granulicella sp. S190 TaxID=1747226 RepID=UPI00131CC099|nr:GGDEF domain-containing protein [Granulicella sp. S190]
MNYRLTPDLAAMATLLAILYFLRKRHPQDRVDLWISGLLFIFLESLAHAFYTPKGRWHLSSHIVALDAYLAAGVIFLWAAAKSLFPRRPTLYYLWLNSLPLLAVLTTYGFDVRTPGIFHVFIGCGLVLGTLSPFVLARTWRLGRAWWIVGAQICVWSSAWLFASNGMYRDAAYLPLFALYATTAIHFQLSLPSKSLGKVAIVLGFTIWALVFLLHSWVTNRPQYIDVAAQIWDMQKFLVTIGMLLVMLEHQVTSNEWYAFHDHLTGLPNRRLFEDRLGKALCHAERTHTRTALLMLDLNGFKLINDVHGHDTGDEVLQHISHHLRAALRVPDTLARLGGDEFIVIATDLPVERPAARIADDYVARISEALRKPVQINGSELTVSGSIGVAIYPDDTLDEVLLRRLADQRMYEQKRQTLVHV